jgi:hypothetical protein
MSSVRPSSRWLFLVSPRWLGWHAFVVFAAFGMLWLGDWQFHRAESGNALSWAYTFEWPVFAVFGVVFWVKTIIDEVRPAGGDNEAAQVDLPPGAAVPRPAGQAALAAGQTDDGEQDPELAAYNAYLARLNKQVQGHGRWHGLR